MKDKKNIKFNKSLRFKVTIFVFILSCLIISVIYFLAKSIIIENFRKIENEFVSKNVQLTYDSYLYTIENLNIKLSDWAIWDDTYNFIQNNNIQYIESNLLNETFVNLGVDLMIFINNDGKVVYAKGVDRMDGTDLNIPEDLILLISKNSLLTKHSSVDDHRTGLLSLDSGFLKFASRPIVKSNNDGPTIGTLIFATYFDDDGVGVLSNLVNLPIKILLPDNNNHSNEISVFIKEDESDKIYGSKLVNDFFGNPAFVFEITNIRDIFLSGIKSVDFFTQAFIVSEILLLILLVFLANKFLIFRIKKLFLEVNKIGYESEKVNMRVSVDQGDDEISLLQININNMLDLIDSSKDKIIAEGEKAKHFFEVVFGIAVVLDKNSNVISINKNGAKMLEYEEDEILGKNWIDNFIPEKDRDSVRNLHKDASLNSQSEKYKYFENSIKTKSGNEVSIGWHNSVLLDKNGEVFETFSHGEDITERRKEEEIDRKEKDELENLNKLMIGRELKMAELKKEIEELKKGGER